MKPVNPYTTLRNEAREWARSVIHPRTVIAFQYTTGHDELRARVATAAQLGYEVVLTVDDLVNPKVLTVTYRKTLPSPPWAIRP